MNVLFLGDISGRTGRESLFTYLYDLKEKLSIDFCIANCENVAGGFGATAKHLDELLRAGVDAFTTGNHVYSKKEIIPLLDGSSYDIIRPYNLPKNDPGKGTMICTTKNGDKIAVINLLGRLFLMLPTDEPFAAIDKAIDEVSGKADIILVDFHAEATSEKRAMGYYLDGRVSAVLGTHTHVQTADEQILPKGTAYITDVGMCGAKNSVLGANIHGAIGKLTSAVQSKFEIAKGAHQFNAIFMNFDSNGKCLKVERIYIGD